MASFRSKPSDLARVRDTVVIPKEQLNIHKGTEGLSVFFVVPLTAFLALRGGRLTPAERVGLGLVALGSLAVDGWLLTRWDHLEKR